MKKIALYCLAFCALMASGCQTAPKISDIVIGPDYEVSNYHHPAPSLPPEIRRIAVLPITSSAHDAQAGQGKEHLQEIVRSELDKMGRFEAVYIAPEQLKRWSGRENWRAEDVIVKSTLDKLGAETGAQGILFVHLSNYSPYPPLLIGWKMKLARLDTMEILWALDEVFDAGQESVSNSARRFSKHRVPVNPVLADSRTVLISPAMFARYSLTASLATIPAR